MNQASTGWPPASGVTGWGQVPQNLMPKRTQAWPRGTQSAANDAERLLSTAVGWWDAAWYTPGDRWLRNRGVAGELLDMRLGSSLAANSNDPLYLAPEATGYCYLPGVVGNYLSVPDESALRLTGDIELIARCALDTWTPGTAFQILGKYVATGNQRAYRLRLDATTGTLSFIFSADGSAATIATSTAGLGLTARAAKWVRVTRVASSGLVKFYFSDDGATWTQLGNDVSAASGAMYASTALVEIGANVTLNEIAAGRVYRAIVKDGIDGTTVLDVDCDVLTSGSATSFTAATGQTVTINRSTAGRKTVAQPARGRGGRALFLLGTDDYLEVQDNWQHQLLNFYSGQPLSVMAVARQWNTTANERGLISKATGVLGGWALVNTGAPAMRFWSPVSSGAPTASYVIGDLVLFTGVVSNIDRRIYVNTSATSGTTPYTWTAAMQGTVSTRIGQTNNNTDMEFTAAAVFRRALTAAEIATLSTYYTNRGF